LVCFQVGKVNPFTAAFNKPGTCIFDNSRKWETHLVLSDDTEKEVIYICHPIFLIFMPVLHFNNVFRDALSVSVSLDKFD